MNTQYKILIAEDLPSDLALAEREIKTVISNYLLKVVDDEKRFIKELVEFEPDLIISDYSMPTFDGMRALIIRQEKAPLTPFIMVTGSINEETAVECMKAGADDYVIKEHIKRLGPAIVHALEQKEIKFHKKRTEELLLESEYRYHTFINTSNDLMYVKDENLNYIVTNVALQNFFGKSNEEILNKKDKDLMNGHYAKLCYESDMRALSSSVPVVTEEVFGEYTYETTKFRLNLGINKLGIGGIIKDITNRKEAENKLKDNKAKLDMALNAARMGVWHFDIIQNKRTFDLQVCKMLGIDHEKFRGTTEEFFNILHPEDRFKVQKELDKTIELGAPYTPEYRVIWPDKSVHYIAAHGNVLRDKEGKALSLSGVVMDITERKQAEILQKIQYNIANGIVNLRNEKELFLFIRHELSFLLDTTNFYIALYDDKTDLLHTPIHEDEKDEVNVWPAEKSLTGLVIKRKKTLLVNKSEISKLANNGEIQLLGARSELWLGTPILNDNQVIGAIVVQSYTDPNAYNQNTKELLEIIANQLSTYFVRKQVEETNLKLIKGIEQSPLSIVITDFHGDIEYTNPKFTDVTGYLPYEVIGNKPSILKSGYQNDQFYKNLWQTITLGQEWHGEFQNKKKNGELYWESASISPVMSETGLITHFIAVKEDITEKKRIFQELIVAKEKAEESDRLKSSFLNNISHEIRTPLNGIIGFIELLSDPSLSPRDIQEYTEIIRDCGYQLINVVTDTVNISLVESGQEKLFLKEFDLNKSLGSLYTQFSELNKKENIKFSFASEISNDDSIIVADEVKLKQIVSNLLANAVKFTSKGKIDLKFKKENNMLHICVKDTGIGIAAENHKFIFDRFAKVESDHSVLFRGTGLGLAICKAYTELMNGKIWVESELGHGSEFHLTIPCQKKQEALWKK